MEYGINIDYLIKDVSVKDAAAFLAKAGFTQLDYTPPLLEDSWETSMREAKKIFEANGLTVHQMHAPFNRYGRYGDKHALCLARCTEAAAFLGAKFIAVHGDEFDFEHCEFSPEAALAYNHELFLPYVEGVRKFGCKMAFETIFEDGSRRRFTSRADELLALIDSFPAGSAACCWDFGHAHVSFRHGAAEQMRRFGSRIQCMHLHDNTGVDAHAIPLTGDIRWQEVMGALKEIGYTGIMSLEYSHGTIPRCLMENFLTLSCNSAKHLWAMGSGTPIPAGPRTE